MKGNKVMNLAFKIGVFDKRLNRTIISEARADRHGVMAILENLTTLEVRERNKFLRDLIGLGVATHEPVEGATDFPYAITAMKL